MDHLKLLQFKKILNPLESSYQGCHFLKTQNINVNSIIPDKSSESSELNDYAGYTYLHFAAKNSDLAAINELIRRNADLVKQDSKYGQTPLHIVSEKVKRSYSTRIWSFVGKLEENEFVDLLLSTQVRNNVAINPKCKRGFSHLHIAAIYNKTEAVKLFLNNGESVDHATNPNHRFPGYTALHFAVTYSCYEVADILLKHGADVHLKDCKDRSVLHCLIQRLMDIADFLVIGKMSYYPFYERERDTVESILMLVLKNKKLKGTNVLNDTGFTPLHLACTLNASTTAKRFLKQKINLNVATKSDCKLWPGWTPLHFAACFSIETFKLLLCRGADLGVKNARGETPLDLCMQRYSPHIVHSILSVKEDFKNILFTDGSTKLLDIILIMTNEHMFINWFRTLPDPNISVPIDSPIWPGSNLLHLAVLNERIRLKSECMVFEEHCSVNRIEVALLQSWKIVMSRLLDRCSFTKKNVDGFSPFQLALKLHKRSSVKRFLNVQREDGDDIEDLTRFHIACAAGNKETVEWFVDKKEVDVDEPVECSFEWYVEDYQDILMSVRAKSTPLHVAVIFDREELVDYLLEEDADVYAEDWLGLTPIHLSLMGKRYGSGIPKALFEKTEDLEDCVTSDGLSYLHVAAYHDNVTAIEELLRNGADVNVRFQPINTEVKSMLSKFAGQTPLHTAMSNRNFHSVEALIKGGADIFAVSENSSRQLIHEAMGYGDYMFDHFLAKLRRKIGNATGPIDESGVTMLHFACLKGDVKWAELQLKRGADPNARVRDDFDGDWSGSTPMDVLARRFSDREGWMDLVQLLIRYGADVTVKNGHGCTPLHVIHKRAHRLMSLSSREEKTYRPLYLTAIETLIKSQKIYDVNPTDPHGLSHFHLACQASDLKILKKFLDAGIDVNHSCDLSINPDQYAGCTSLHLACEQKRSGVACLLMERGADVRVENLGGNTPLHLALKSKCFDMKMIKLLLRRGADINAKNIEGKSPIQYLMMTEGFTLGMFKFMLDQGAVINFMDMEISNSGIIGFAMKNAKPSGRLQIFKRMIGACNRESIIKSSFNAIESAVNVINDGQLTVDFYLNIIQQLVDIGCNVDLQDEEGKTALHRAVQLTNYEAVKALLLFGANFNIADKYGESPITRDVIESYNISVRRSNILILLATQVWKMGNIGLNVTPYNKTTLAKIARLLPIDYDSVRSSSLSELRKTEEAFFHDGYSIRLSDFLSEREAVSEYSRLPLEVRETIDSIFQDASELRKDFPEWAGFITMQYRKAVARAKMIKVAMKIIFFAGIKLPTLILREIVEYLDYGELKILVD